MLLLFFPEFVAQPEPEPVIVTPTPENRSDLIREEREDIESVHFTPPDGMSFSMRFDAFKEGYLLEGNDIVFPGRQYVMDSVFNNISRLVNLTVVTERADDAQLDLFGLSSPAMKIRLIRVNGSTVDIEVGNMPAAGSGRYARIHNTREVFLLNDTQSKLLTLGIEDVYDISFFPLLDYPDMEAATFAVNNILIETETGTIELRRRTDEEFEGVALGASAFMLLQPAAGEANDSIVQSVIIENALNIMPGIIEEAHPEDLSVFGLDAPAKLTLSTEDWTGTLLIGDRSPEQGGRYIMIEGHDAVLLDLYGDYSFLDANYSQLRTGLIWIHSITDVSTVTFEMEETTRVLYLEHNADESMNARLDDVEISETNGRRLFVSALMITQNGETDAQIPTDDAPAYKIIMSLADGSQDMLELYRINDSQFLIVYNGASTGLFITRMAIQANLLDRFDIVDAGGDLPMV